jgi:hypothetical protein
MQKYHLATPLSADFCYAKNPFGNPALTFPLIFVMQKNPFGNSAVF